IEEAAKGKGVQKVDWDIASKMLTLHYFPALVNINKIKNRIVEAGHDLLNKKAKDNVYNELPECCHYREQDKKAHDAENINTDEVRGIVLEADKKGQFNPLYQASIKWLNTERGVLTDSLGYFSIPMTSSSNRLIISYIGYKSDTFTVENPSTLKVILADDQQLQNVTVTNSRRSSYISTISPIRSEIMTAKELLKAACCNLSESFETNPSVDVSYNDAVTGSKQIQLLGLSGNYTQLTVENLPGPRGLATPLGLNSIAGPWIESIQLTKGVGSVANGFESIAGQINVELKKPAVGERLLANIYINEFGKTDLNLNLQTKLSEKWSAGLLLHYNFLNNSN
ncbi:MAG: carboxypeptidase-like regulatory domain-containing protein, partial [Sediminibacterium sp.]|nr:carboxypeptidase-like regulatory domain-containing protein [Sediminibacterium sp.]